MSDNNKPSKPKKTGIFNKAATNEKESEPPLFAFVQEQKKKQPEKKFQMPKNIFSSSSPEASEKKSDKVQVQQKKEEVAKQIQHKQQKLSPPVAQDKKQIEKPLPEAIKPSLPEVKIEEPQKNDQQRKQQKQEEKKEQKQNQSKRRKNIQKKNEKKEKIVIKTVEKLEAQIQQKNEQIQEVSNKVEDLEYQIDIKNKAYEELEKQKNRVEQNIRICAQSKIQQGKEKKAQFIKQLEGVKKDMNQLKQQIEDFKGQLQLKVNERRQLEIKKNHLQNDLKKTNQLSSLQKQVNENKHQLQQIYQKFKNQKKALQESIAEDQQYTIKTNLLIISKAGDQLLDKWEQIKKKVSQSQFSHHITISEKQYDFSYENEKKQDQKQKQDKKDKILEPQNKETDKKEEKKQQEKKVQPQKKPQIQKVQKEPKKEIQQPEVSQQINKKQNIPQQNKINIQTVHLQQKKEKQLSVENKKPSLKVQQQKEGEQSQINKQPSEVKSQNIPEEKPQKPKPNQSNSNGPNPKLEGLSQLISSLTQSLSKLELLPSQSSKLMEKLIKQKRNTFKKLKETIKQYEDYYNQIADQMDMLDSDADIRYEQILKEAQLALKQQKQFFKRADQLLKEKYDNQDDEQKQEKIEEEKIKVIHDDPQPKFKPLYNEHIEEIKHRYNPHQIRFVLIIQKYLNQLRVLIQLFNINQEELKKNHFDRSKYEQLITKKTQVLQLSNLPAQPQEAILNSENYITLMDKMDEIQAEMQSLQDGFDEQYVRGLYNIPQNNLKMTKQYLFEIACAKQLSSLERKLNTMKQDTLKMQNYYKNLVTERQKLQKQKKDLQNKKDEDLKKQKEKHIRQFFPGEQGNKLIQRDEFGQQYNVHVENEKQIKASYEELGCDTKLKEVNEILDELIKERQKEKQALTRAKEEQVKAVRDNRQRKNRTEPYMGDAVKAFNHPKVIELGQIFMERQTQFLKLKQKNISSSKISQPSRIISYILE